jgi:hypothetical protein
MVMVWQCQSPAQRDIRRPPRATNPYSAAWRHCDAGFVEGIEDGDSQIRACATTFVQVGRLIFISALIV